MNDPIRLLTEDEDSTSWAVTPDEIRAFLDGRMSADEREELEAMIDAFPELRLEVEDFRRERVLEAQEGAEAKAQSVPKRSSRLGTWFSLALAGAGAATLVFGVVQVNIAERGMSQLQVRGETADMKVRQAEQLLLAARSEAQQNQKLREDLQKLRDDVEARRRELNGQDLQIRQKSAQLEREESMLRSALARAVEDSLYPDEPGTASNTSSLFSRLEPDREIVSRRTVVLRWVKRDPGIRVTVRIAPRFSRVRDEMNWDAQRYTFPNLSGNTLTVTLPSVKGRYRVVVYDWKVESTGEISDPKNGSFAYIESGR